MSSFIKNNGINGNKDSFGRVKGASFPSQLPFTPNNSANGFTRNGIFNSKSPTMNTNNNFNGNLDKAINISSNINKSFNEIREKGVIEKLLTSYGFVQCSDRKGRFFFHYSEYKGALNSLKIGDAVEFEESCDKRTGKPVAVMLMKVSGQDEVFREVGKPVEGVILNALNGDSMEGTGRVTYEQGGETFFLPYAPEDIHLGHKPLPGDKVTFYICTDERNGNPRARGIRKQSFSSLATSLPSPQGDAYQGINYQDCGGCQGVVCSMKDSYGFIERADVVKEIFFHFSEFEGDIDNLRLGDDVHFAIQTRNNKDVAVGISKLELGTVVFEDVAKEWKRGKIKKSIKMASLKKHNEALVGRIVYETLNGSIDIPFGEKDPQGDFTMVLGDIVEFCIATDRRDMVQHATNIRLVDDTFTIAKEKREKGFVTTLKEGFGFIRCTDREARMFFHFSELLNADQDIHLQDELEFTVVQDPSNVTRQVAIRIKVLPLGTIVVAETFLLTKYQGVVQKEAPNNKPMQCTKDLDPGVIMYEVEGTKQLIPYSCSVVDGNLPKLDEKVEFQMSECQKNKTKVAVNVKVLCARGWGGSRERGFVVTMKEAFGFIETADHAREIYFHFSNYEGDIEMLEVTSEVDFSVCNKSGRVSAENIKRMPKHSIPTGEVDTTILEGRLVRSIHSPESSEYHGLIQVLTEADDAATVYAFSIMSLVDKRDTLMSRGDCVKFQVSEVPVSGKTSSSSVSSCEGDGREGVNGVAVRKWACNVACTRKFVQARIESISDTGGTLSYEKESGSKLTFSCRDVQNMAELSLNDEVEFVISNVAGDKVAVNLKKASDRPRPDRLISRVKNVSEDPRVVTIRQPKGPDGSKGFKLRRVSLRGEGGGGGGGGVNKDGGGGGVNKDGGGVCKGEGSLNNCVGSVSKEGGVSNGDGETGLVVVKGGEEGKCVVDRAGGDVASDSTDAFYAVFNNSSN